MTVSQADYDLSERENANLRAILDFCIRHMPHQPDCEAVAQMLDRNIEEGGAVEDKRDGETQRWPATRNGGPAPRSRITSTSHIMACYLWINPYANRRQRFRETRKAAPSHTQGMPAVVQFPQSAEAPASGTLDSTVNKVFEAITLLLSTLPLEDQRRVLDKLKSLIQPIATPRAGEVLGKIVHWIPRDSAWTVDEAKQGISAQGVSASPKEVYNALAYLTRKGHIRRIGYGRYIVDGAELVTSDDIGGKQARWLMLESVPIRLSHTGAR